MDLEFNPLLKWGGGEQQEGKMMMPAETFRPNLTVVNNQSFTFSYLHLQNTFKVITKSVPRFFSRYLLLYFTFRQYSYSFVLLSNYILKLNELLVFLIRGCAVCAAGEGLTWLTALKQETIIVHGY